MAAYLTHPAAAAAQDYRANHATTIHYGISREMPLPEKKGSSGRSALHAADAPKGPQQTSAGQRPVERGRGSESKHKPCRRGTIPETADAMGSPVNDWFIWE